MSVLSVILEIVAALTQVAADVISGREKTPAPRVKQVWAVTQSKLAFAEAEDRARDVLPE